MYAYCPTACRTLGPVEVGDAVEDEAELLVIELAMVGLVTTADDVVELDSVMLASFGATGATYW
jgi:hypothetical protein